MTRLPTSSRSAGTRKQPLRIAASGVTDDCPRRHDAQRFGRPALQEPRKKPPLCTRAHRVPGSKGV